MKCMNILNINKTLFKIIIWIGKKINPNNFKQISKIERDVLLIFNHLVKDPNSDLNIHPSYNKYYVKSSIKGIFISISVIQSEISIINHVYGYNVKVSHRVLRNIEDTFKKEIEYRINKMEHEYTNNIQHSLNHIVQTIKHDNL
jgi:hypothetical protein